jgi:PBP1b-binding outer membrane lipoprotein LpoB
MKKFLIIGLISGLTLIFASCSSSSHTMDDNTQMDGATHTEKATHTMDDGTNMNGATMDDGMESQ